MNFAPCAASDVKYAAEDAVICEDALFSNITSTMWSKAGTLVAAWAWEDAAVRPAPRRARDASTVPIRLMDDIPTILAKIIDEFRHDTWPKG
ncbi:hypothetical protein L3i22_031460 [Actinoplanes sp. L3-i22]|nr:hypothetical protein L3i22_031460 [Actinoplanes sp. L3-i22]